MANTIVTPKKTPFYQLSESALRAILSGTDSTKLAKNIEKKRQKFIENNGNDGLSIITKFN